MIFTIAMNTNRHTGLSLLEILMAIGIAGIIITTAFGTIGNIYFSQKKIRVSQDFHSEIRFLMERIVQMSRNNTIDYDRFYINNPDRCSDNYPTEFFETISTGNVRNLGGIDVAGTIDVCTEAWDKDVPQNTLYLISGDRSLQTAIRRTPTEDDEDPTYHKIEIEKLLGADSDNDGQADIWSATPLWDDDSSGLCEIEDGASKFAVLGDSSSRDFCNKAHEWTIISPDAIEIEELLFEPSPYRDPFLSFAVEDAQIHPHVFIALKGKLRNPESFGLESSEAPDTLLQTTASSRVFGNTRK